MSRGGCGGIEPRLPVLPSPCMRSSLLSRCSPAGSQSPVPALARGASRCKRWARRCKRRAGAGCTPACTATWRRPLSATRPSSCTRNCFGTFSLHREPPLLSGPLLPPLHPTVAAAATVPLAPRPPAVALLPCLVASVSLVRRCVDRCYTLIEKMGRGVVYYGSARLKDGCPYWAPVEELGEKVSRLLGSTTWTGGGPGMMEAATRGAQRGGGTVAGIRIAREAGTTVGHPGVAILVPGAGAGRHWASPPSPWPVVWCSLRVARRAGHIQP